MEAESHSVLLVSRDSKIVSQISAFLVPPLFELTTTSDFNEARRLATERSFNIIIADSGDGYDTDFAINLADSYSTILLLVPNEHFDEISYRVEGYGILTITKPFEPFYLYNMMKIAIAVQYKVQVLSSQTTKLKVKMEEIKQVNRAKMLLMQNMKMTEQEAHRYIEKEAMDRGMKKTAISEEIIKTYG
ncbi:ANTAR domain-containing response regulator [Treponema bryantii]|uniref:ANTAR domain-containing response regulator n=1 Tax=Treponema bryantii TaxID=163 RepID=UPI0003B475B1|nr:ANTAR domain-containing protein [Treponema bryantii]